MGVFDTLDILDDEPEVVVSEGTSEGNSEGNSEGIARGSVVSSSSSSSKYETTVNDERQIVVHLQNELGSNVSSLVAHDVEYPYFEIRLGEGSSMNGYQLENLKEMLASTDSKLFSAEELTELYANKEIISVSIGLRSYDSDGQELSHKVVGSVSKTRLKQLRALTSSMVTKFYPSEGICLDGNSVLALY